MVTTVTPYSDSRNRAYPGEGFDGVVRVAIDNYYGTGVLLYDGRAILTAAHLFSDTTSSIVQIYFETASGRVSKLANRITPMATYDATQGNDDLALLWLSSSAPVDAERYGLYRGSDEIGKTMTMVGYGTPGSGDAGILDSYSSDPLRLKACNRFDADAATLKGWLGSAMGWTPASGTQLVADFDNGTSDADASGRLMNLFDTGLGTSEGLSSPGDSGGPAFIDGRIAGITSYIASLARNSIAPDIDDVGNGSFGEIGFWQRVSHYQEWIDQSLRAQYPNAPTKPEEVQKTVNEANSGTGYVYFLVRFTGMRSDATQVLSVDYATRDGSATAGEDYIAAVGTLTLYPDEIQAVIPVEVIGDTLAEPDETFYLDLTNPVGGSFGEGVVKLTAMRTIMNDDGGIWA